MARKGKSFSIGFVKNAQASPYQRSAIQQGMSPAKAWNAKDLPEIPKGIDVPTAKKQLDSGFNVIDPRGREIRFDKSIISHWKDEGYDSRQIDGRLVRLGMARETVSGPAEIWEQYNQEAYVQVFVKPTGSRRGCVVFVKNDGSVITYFPKDLKAMEKVRKGILLLKS